MINRAQRIVSDVTETGINGNSAVFKCGKPQSGGGGWLVEGEFDS
jgi:hypothetical protein